MTKKILHFGGFHEGREQKRSTPNCGMTFLYEVGSRHSGEFLFYAATVVKKSDNNVSSKCLTGLGDQPCVKQNFNITELHYVKTHRISIEVLKL